MNRPVLAAPTTNGHARHEHEPVPLIDVQNAATSSHFVQFYADDTFLVTSVAQFALEGLRGAGRVIIIATAEHARSIATRLEAAGLDLAALELVGRYTALDAADTLRRFIVDGKVDAGRFAQIIGSEVARAAAAGGPLRLFGEMVALLWAEGKGEAALRLEELWNELGERHAFTLLCAYPLKDFAQSSCGTTFRHVCAAHGRVLPAEDFGAPGQSADERLRAIAILQQKALALEAEVTERRRVEDELRRSRSELSAFIESATIGLHWIDTDGTLLWANNAELEMLGYPRDEYLGHSIAEFHVDRSAADDLLARLGRGENLRSYEARLRCKNGAIKIVSIDASGVWDNGRFIHIQGFTHDVTKQREAEEHSRRLAAIVESSDDAIISKTLEGTITSWNDAAQRIFGYTAAEAIGKNITMLIPLALRGEEPLIVSRVARGEPMQHYETVRQRKDGSRVEISLTVSPIKDRDGRIVGVSKIARDITERRRAEQVLRAVREELLRSNEELERRVQERTAALAEAVAQMEEFSYTVSHDLRAPLRGMQVYSQALLEDHAATLDPEARHCLVRIAENATRLDKMVHDVLTFSRVSRNEIRLGRVSLDSLVRGLIQHYPDMQPPRARVAIEPLADVLGHEPSLTQAISNLLTNAVKFVAAGVTPEVRLWTERRGSVVRLWVSDNGIGIKPSHQARLFRMFERVHPGLPYEGTGVGLAIVRKALTRMGGDAGMESDGSCGSRFWIQLPEAPPTL